MVDAAAILGRRISFDLLAAVTGSGEDELIAILRHLVAGNVMVEEEPDVFAFRHALTREAIAGRLLGRKRRRLHDLAVAAVERQRHAEQRGACHGCSYAELVEAARKGAGEQPPSGYHLRGVRLARPISPRQTDLNCRPPPQGGLDDRAAEAKAIK